MPVDEIHGRAIAPDPRAPTGLARGDLALGASALAAATFQANPVVGVFGVTRSAKRFQRNSFHP